MDTTKAPGRTPGWTETDVAWLYEVLRLSSGQAVRKNVRTTLETLDRHERLVPRGLMPTLRALMALYDVVWNKIGTLDPGTNLVSDGVKLTTIGGLITYDDDRLLTEAAEAVGPHEAAVRAWLAPPGGPETGQ